MDHVMFRTPDIDKSVLFYETVFGMQVDSIDDHPSDNYKLVFMLEKNSGIKLEITYNYGVDIQEESGRAFGHVGFYVDNAIEMCDKSMLMGYHARYHRHKSSVGNSYIIGVIMSPEGLEIAVVEKLS